MIYVLQRFTVCAVLLWSMLSRGQGTLTITFDGPPDQVPGSQILVQQYFETGMSFQPLPGSDGFARVATGVPPEWPNNGTRYLQATTGDSLTFAAGNGSSFGLASVDLAAFSVGLPNYTVSFIGYRADGSIVATSFFGSGINFQTYNFALDWQSGITRVEIPNYGWSLDNLVVTVPEPNMGSLLILGALSLLVWQRQRRNSCGV